ncbi:MULTISPECIES: SRPBCC domain-containing protein [Gammaproteobacteria]|uniref:SRPBCC domain-containing protein n=1 Tax=Gammaproteobacteria TaxID=1236 RepID=UPI000DCFD89E|nr:MULTISPECIES: SRPBCC domain-containing protein [Gammaproteobacteria]RTE87061.1 SRPBCC domain-containing protein [Aliidiomarina sp. B3213]TCZ93149.1 SRPBCC domain-containing protein [Lysobacter sp. N42]
MKKLIYTTAIVAVLTGLYLPLPSVAEVKSSSESGFHLEINQAIDTTPEVAYHHFVNDIAQWWLSSHTWFGNSENLSIEARAGGCFCELNGDQQAEHMMVSFVDPSHKIMFTGGLGPLKGMGLNGALTFEFRTQTVKVTYIADGYPTTNMQEFAPLVDNVLTEQMNSFSAYLNELY